MFPPGDQRRQEALDKLEDWYEGRELAALSSRPSVAPEARAAWRCYWALQGERLVYPMGGVGRVKYRAISQWARDHGMEGQNLDLLVDLVGRLDEVFLEYQNETSGKGNAKADAD